MGHVVTTDFNPLIKCRLMCLSAVGTATYLMSLLPVGHTVL